MPLNHPTSSLRGPQAQNKLQRLPILSTDRPQLDQRKSRDILYSILAYFKAQPRTAVRVAVIGWRLSKVEYIMECCVPLYTPFKTSRIINLFHPLFCVRTDCTCVWGSGDTCLCSPRLNNMPIFSFFSLTEASVRLHCLASSFTSRV